MDKIIKTVSVIVRNEEGKILALKRSPDKKWYPNKWDIISGTFNETESSYECFCREILEEIGISTFELIEKRWPYIYEEKGQSWLVQPYRCTIGMETIRLNSEHSEYKWMTLQEILNSDHAAPLRTELAVFYDVEKI